MHIKKLEISGFKSFVDRTVIHFDHDVVGIVGPNGCGKSNIVDAIRWCMGEQSAKHLRGRAMTDVIFAGSSGRGPHGMAEVTLTFDNTDKARSVELPLEYRDWAEIAITRRLYRDGTSEYLINKTQVRLKDVTDLFLGTGVGTKAYSIIEQGKVGLIVSARAEDRRMLIEEAAGITKYKARRKQAEQKMDATRQNLLRVGDIVTEIERSLASLKRQAAKAERYISYKGELEDLILHEASHKLLELTVCAQVEVTGLEATQENAESLTARLAAQEAELEVARLETATAEDAAQRAQTDAFRAETELRASESEIERSRTRFGDLESRRKFATSERNELAGRLGELEGEREALIDSLDAAEEEESRSESEMRGHAERLDELRASQEEADRRLNETRRRLADCQAKTAATEASLRGFESRSSDLSRRRLSLEEENAHLTEELESLQDRVEGARESALNLSEAKTELLARRAHLEEQLKEGRQASMAVDRQVDAAKGELSQKRNRLRALEELHARMDGVGQGTKALLSSKHPAVVGLLGDRFETEARFTQALAAALAEKTEWVVVSDLAAGATLLAGLAESRKGRASILSQRPAYVARPAHTAPEGTLGRLADLVEFAPADQILAEVVLGATWVMPDLAAAFEAQRDLPTHRFVTLDGTLLGDDGSVTGGQGDRVAAGLLEQKREIRELHESVDTAATEVTRLIEEQDRLRDALAASSKELDQSRSDVHEAELAHVTAENNRKRCEEQLGAVQKRLTVVRTESSELEGRIQSAQSEFDRAEAELATARDQKRDLDGAYEESEAAAEAWRDQVARAQSVVTERKVLLAQAKERANSVRQTVERLSKSCVEMTGRIAKLDQEALECAIGAGRAAAQWFQERALLSIALERTRQCEGDLHAAKTALEALRISLSEREQSIKSTRADAQAAVDALRKHEQNLARLEIERRHLVEGVRERFRGLELATIVGDYHKRPLVGPEHRTRIVELTDLLDRIGPVNLDAVKEHAEAEGRHHYYATQKADLDKAIADLEQAILQMNRETKRLFREAFDGINAKFKTLFPKMFRGGQAELRLTNADDLLETGIEILAQPPGKKLSSIELMSGGEKALTAVSLIFAIFHFKPSPFCILDEVDAPLDEANVTRYNEGIRLMTESSQFILITHIKKTMQSVDMLYGVTMQEPGVSKLVSVKVNENATPRSLLAQPGAAQVA